jgi:hypothetical protein
LFFIFLFYLPFYFRYRRKSHVCFSTLALCSGGPGFKFKIRDRLYWQDFVVLLSHHSSA